jgi:hypothetical protein
MASLNLDFCRIEQAAFNSGTYSSISFSNATIDPLTATVRAKMLNGGELAGS